MWLFFITQKSTKKTSLAWKRVESTSFGIRLIRLEFIFFQYFGVMLYFLVSEFLIYEMRIILEVTVHNHSCNQSYQPSALCHLIRLTRSQRATILEHERSISSHSLQHKHPPQTHSAGDFGINNKESISLLGPAKTKHYNIQLMKQQTFILFSNGSLRSQCWQGQFLLGV